MAMTIVEKILARQSGSSEVRPGQIVTVDVETCVITDSMFRPNGVWRWPTRVYDRSKIVLIADHLPMSASIGGARAQQTMRRMADYYGIERRHFAGAKQGISHQVIADNGYARPGTVLALSDSHTLSAGAFNCAARGLGQVEMLYVLCTGKTWFRVGPTVRYELHGRLRPGVTTKDVFLYLAGRWGAHTGQNLEFAGPAQASLSLDARRTLSTMCAEVSAEFALWEPDDVLLDFLATKPGGAIHPTWPDSGATYLDVRTIDLSEVEPHVSGVDTVVHNTCPVSEFNRTTRLDQCVVGSCANGTLDDLRTVADILRGRQVAPWVRFIVTPGSAEIYREASSAGILNDIVAAGATVTPSACGACAAQDFGALAPGEVCLTATTRNFKGRMGSPDAQIYLASPATVAASAVIGYIAGVEDLLVDRPAQSRSAGGGDRNS